MTNCENCTRHRLWRNTGRRDSKTGAIIRQCTSCGHYQSEPPPQGQNLPRKILYYDIENTKMTVRTFGLSVPSKRLSWHDIEKPPYLLCWSAAWITSETTAENIRVFGDVVSPYEARRRKDKRCLSGLWEAMNRADALVGHNIKSFDTKKTHLRFLLNRMGSPDLTVKQLDTLTEARKRFKNDSDTLGYWLGRLGYGGKDKMESEDWDKCEAGDEAALRKMAKYNRQDVRGGVQVFLEFDKYLRSGGVELFKW